MNPRSNVRTLFGRKSVRKSNKATGRKHPFLENLEDRVLLASLVYQAVDSTPLTLLQSGNKIEVVKTANPNSVLASTNLNQITGGVLVGANGFNVSLTIDASLPTGVPGGVLFDGGSGTSTLLGPNANNTWDITGLGSGDIGGPTDVQFTHLTSLTGNTKADTFVFASGASVAGTITGGTGTNTLNYAAYQSSSPVTMNLALNTATGTGGISGITSVVGGQGSDTLVGPAAGSTWSLSGANAGNVAGVTFTSFENLVGGAGADTLVGPAAGQHLEPLGLEYGHCRQRNFHRLRELDGRHGARHVRLRQWRGGSRQHYGRGWRGHAELLVVHDTGNGQPRSEDGNGHGRGQRVHESHWRCREQYAGRSNRRQHLESLRRECRQRCRSDFTSFENLVGPGADTLVGPAAGSTWSLSGSNTGTVGSVTFTGFENLTGGAGPTRSTSPMARR